MWFLIFINVHLFKDYLKYSELDQSLEVFLLESGQPDTSANRAYLRRELGLPEESTDVFVILIKIMT